MNLISITFVLLLGGTLLVYYLLPQRIRWYALLAASLAFYARSGWKRIVFVLIASVIGYATALRIQTLHDRGEDRKKARNVLICGVALVLVMLVWSKTFSLWAGVIRTLSGGRFAYKTFVPLGISYYTFALVGYMADVYWKKEKAQENHLKLLLYLIYFPQITQGPIPRYGKLAPRLFAGTSFDYERMCFGLQRMVWGFFKKAVAADRLALITAAVFSGKETYPGSICLFAVVCSAFQLYFDFSGCMDIVIGASECFGITLDENFSRPFFATSAAQFWRRWHITLGTWFKDYVYLPVSISRPVTGAGKFVKKRFGRKAARYVPTVISLAAVWILTGLWHGTGADYILWGCYWGTIIICSTVFAKEIKALDARLHINTSGKGWQVWQMVRTFLIYCGGRALTAPGSLAKAGGMLARIFTGFHAAALTDGTLLNLGLNGANMIVLCAAFVLIAMFDIAADRGVNIRGRVAALPVVLRWTAYYLLIMAVVIFGRYGASIDASSFIYAGF